MSNRARTRTRPGGAQGPRRIPTLAIVLAAVAAVVVVGVIVALGRGGDDDGDTADLPSFGPVAVEGPSLPGFEQSAGDPAIGEVAPILEAVTPGLDSGRTTVGRGGPTVVVFLAHWCPHCQAEVPVLVDMAADGAFDDARLVGVLTGTNRDAPNFPPVAWLEREEWPGDIVLDDDEFTAAQAYGLAGYPFMVVLDADGRVVGRTSGEQPPEVIEALVEAAGG